MQQDPIGDGMNWYVYAGNNPVVWVDPEGLWGGGVCVSETTDLGLGFAGVGQTGSAGYAIFGGGPGGTEDALFASWGGFAGGSAGSQGTGWGVGWPCEPSDDTAIGAYAGGGLNVFVTSANSADDLAGAAVTRNVNVGKVARVFSVQTSEGDDAWGVAYGGIPLPGVGLGVAASTYGAATAAVGKLQSKVRGISRRASGWVRRGLRRVRSLF